MLQKQLNMILADILDLEILTNVIKTFLAYLYISGYFPITFLYYAIYLELYAKILIIMSAILDYK